MRPDPFLSPAGTVLHRFLHGPAIDQIFADESSVDGLLWDLGDNQNTTRDVVNNSGTVVNHVTYSAFGVMASESNTAKTPFFAYTGRDWDEDLQLQYNRARWYEPGTGRWLNEDPDRFGAGDTNLQRYVGNGPTNGTDPSGLEKIDIRDDRGGGTLFIYSDYSLFTPRTETGLLAKVPYRCSERDIALENARKVLANEKLQGLREALRKGINAADLAARIAAEGVDTVNDIVEFAQQPSTAGAAAIALPAFAGKVAKTCLKNATKSGNAVIGRLDDLNPRNLRDGEHTLLDQLSGDLGSAKANWQRNSSVLRDEMRKGLPIRDASAHLPDTYVLPDGRTIRQTFLGMERNTLRNRGWSFDGEFWNPPNN